VSIRSFVAVLHLPDTACATVEVYDQFDRLAGAGGLGHTRRPAALGDAPPSTWRGELRNDLAAAAMDLNAELRAAHEAVDRAAGLPVCLTGSGSGMFLLCDDADEAAAVLRRLPGGLLGRTILVGANPW